MSPTPEFYFDRRGLREFIEIVKFKRGKRGRGELIYTRGNKKTTADHAVGTLVPGGVSRWPAPNTRD